MKRPVAVTLVLLGMALGCGATAVAPIARSWAQPASGRWICYVVDRFPDVQEAQNWEEATNITAGFNKVAAHAPAGTMLAVNPKPGPYPSVACVKY